MDIKVEVNMSPWNAYRFSYEFFVPEESGETTELKITQEGDLTPAPPKWPLSEPCLQPLERTSSF